MRLPASALLRPRMGRGGVRVPVGFDDRREGGAGEPRSRPLPHLRDHPVRRGDGGRLAPPARPALRGAGGSGTRRTDAARRSGWSASRRRRAGHGTATRSSARSRFRPNAASTRLPRSRSIDSRASCAARMRWWTARIRSSAPSRQPANPCGGTRCGSTDSRRGWRSIRADTWRTAQVSASGRGDAWRWRDVKGGFHRSLRERRRVRRDGNDMPGF